MKYRGRRSTCKKKDKEEEEEEEAKEAIEIEKIYMSSTSAFIG